MLDIFSNVFGKSKKSHSSGGHNGASDQSPNDNDGYVFVGQSTEGSRPYNQATILTDENIRMGSSSSIHSNNQQGGSVYPSLDPNSSLPFSNVPTSLNSGPSSISHSSSFSKKHTSPLDNIPFSIMGASGTNSTPFDDEDDKEVWKRIEMIDQFINSSRSQYNFKQENSILRESLLT